MTARTAERHTIDELSYLGTRSEVMIFEARSASSERKHIVTFHSGTGEKTCGCDAMLHGRWSCWHIDLVQQAAEQQMSAVADVWTTCAGVAARLADDQLLRSGHEAADRVKMGAGFWAAQAESDAIFLVCARREWRSRVQRKQEAITAVV